MDRMKTKKREKKAIKARERHERTKRREKTSNGGESIHHRPRVAIPATLSNITINRKTARTAPGTALTVGAVLLFATLLCPETTSPAEIRPVMSPDARIRARAVQHGDRTALMTEIWLDRGDGERPRRLRTYPGAAGTLEFLPDGSSLVYLEHSLRYPAFGSYLAGGRTLPFVNNRIWVLALDGRDESRWPLPPELNSLGIAVSPDGNHLAIRGEWDGSVDWGQPGLWMVDRAGQATQLWIGGTTGTPRWSGDGARVYFVESDTTSEEVKFVHVATGMIDTEAGSKAAGIPVVPGAPDTDFDNTLSAGEQVSLQRALGALQRGLIRYSRMNSAAHRADRHREKDARKAVERMFEALHKHHKKLGISRASCLAYVAALREQQLRPRTASSERVCLEHMLVLNDLARGYAEKHDALPAGHGTLQDWLKHKAEMQATSDAERQRDAEVLDILFGCPAIPESDPQVKYLYRPQAAHGMPVLACFWHRDRYLHLTETAGDRRLEAVDMRSDTVDSLFAVVLQHTREDPAQGGGGPVPACGRPAAEGCAPPH